MPGGSPVDWEWWKPIINAGCIDNSGKTVIDLQFDMAIWRIKG
jgi:hypothetical protein